MLLTPRVPPLQRPFNVTLYADCHLLVFERITTPEKDRSDWAQFHHPARKVYGFRVHVYTYMATKTISITKEAYDRLRSRKGPHESFTDVILRLTERRPLAEYAGMLSKSSVRAIREAIEEARRERRRLDVRA